MMVSEMIAMGKQGPVIVDPRDHSEYGLTVYWQIPLLTVILFMSQGNFSDVVEAHVMALSKMGLKCVDREQNHSSGGVWWTRLLVWSEDRSWSRLIKGGGSVVGGCCGSVAECWRLKPEALGSTPGGTALCRFKGLRTVTAQIAPLIRHNHDQSSDHTRSLVHQTPPVLWFCSWSAHYNFSTQQPACISSHKMGLLLSNHIAKKNKLVRHFNLKGLRQSQNKTNEFCDWQRPPRSKCVSLICTSLLRDSSQH